MFVFDVGYENDSMSVCVCVCVCGSGGGGGFTHVLIIGPGTAELLARRWVAARPPQRLLP